MFRIVRRDPFFPITSLFDDFVKNSGLDEGKSLEDSQNVSAMPLDLTETDSEYRVMANLPGIRKEDVKISLDKNQLVIEASQQKEENPPQPTGRTEMVYHHRERFFGKYHRLIYLPENVDKANIKAKMENGVLELVIPKAAEKPQTFISIE